MLGAIGQLPSFVRIFALFIRNQLTASSWYVHIIRNKYAGSSSKPLMESLQKGIQAIFREKFRLLK